MGKIRGKYQGLRCFLNTVYEWAVREYHRISSDDRRCSKSICWILLQFIMPYFGYGRQDRKDQPRVPISSRVIVDILTTMGADRIITMDLHSTQIQGFAKIPFDNLYSRKIFYSLLKEKFQPEKTVLHQT